MNTKTRRHKEPYVMLCVFVFLKTHLLKEQPVGEINVTKLQDFYKYLVIGLQRPCRWITKVL